MAPKQQKPDKAKQAAKVKVAEDKTFGLKNKSKSQKVQKYVQIVQKQAVADPKARNASADPRKDKKKAEEERQKELAALFAVAIKQPKVPAGVDPKSVVCEFYRHGQCTKGFKCKYSHDLSVERKGHKIDLFTDQRSAEEEDAGMEDWDQSELEKVVAEKHAAENKNRPTAIVCKHFLEAVEKRLYGWFWKCPNGVECKYRHALPPGYVLKSQMKELLEEEAANRKDVVELIEEERAKVDARTPITQQVFLEWRRKKVEQKERDAEDAEAERRKKGILNGREMFLQEGFVVVDDAGAADEYKREGKEEEEKAERLMLEEAMRQQAAARAAEGPPSAAPAGPSGAAAGGPPAGASGAGASEVATTLLLKEEDKALFLQDDDDDDEEMDDDDMGEEDLAQLEAAVKAAHV